MSFATASAVLVLCVLAYGLTLHNLRAEIDSTLARETSAYSAAVASAPASEALVAATKTYLQGRSGGQSGVSPILVLQLTGGKTIKNSDVLLERAAANTVLRAPAAEPVFLDIPLDETVYRTLAVPVLGTDGARIGTFEAALSTGAAQNVAGGVAASLGAAGLLVVFLGSIVSILAARGSLMPLREMAAAARAISPASPGKRMVYDGPADELGTLADALNSMLDRLEESYAEQRRFITDASHELRTPVAIVRGNVELLRSGALAAGDAQEALAMIDDESARMSRLLDELLSLARLEGAAHIFQPLEVRTILDEGAARARLLGERVISVHGPADLWTLGDPDLLDQALLNVLRNAVAHTAEGGHISLTCDGGEGVVRLTVTDDGPGIPEPELARIFDRFYRALGPRPSDSGGAGLGLAIAQRLVTLHGGTITAENVPGTGARFTIELPRIDEPL